MEEQDRIIKRPSTFPMFSKHLALQPTTVVDFANQCRRHYEQFCQAFKKRITIELEYAKNLQAVSKSLDKYIQPGTQKALSFISSAFKVENQQRAHQAKQLAQSLRTQIYEICTSACKQQTNLVKRIQKDFKKYIKEFESLEQNLQRTYDNYEKVSLDTQQLVITRNYLKHTSQIPQQKKAKLISKTMDSIKQKKQYEKLYLSANRNYNQFVRSYNKAVAEDMNQVQNQIRQQIILQADCLRKLIVCQVSMFKNIQYDLINISKQMEALDTQKDIEQFVQQNMNNLDNLIIGAQQIKKTTTSTKEQKRKSISQNVSTKSTQDDMYKQLKPKQSQVDKGLMVISLKHVQQQIFSGKLINKKNKQFKELIDRRWKQLNSKPNNQANNNTNKQEAQSKPQSQQNLKAQLKSQQRKPALIAEQPPPFPQIQQNLNTLKQHFYKYFYSSQFSKQFLQSKKQQQKPQIVNQIYENFLIITRYINEIWNGQNMTLIESKKKNKNQQQNGNGELPLLHIKKTLQISHFYRIISYSYMESFRIHHQVMIQSADRAREIAKFINAILTKSSKQNDIFVLRGVLGLLFTYFWIQNNIKKHMYMENSVYKNSLWKKHDFWDAALFESTYQQMLSFGPQKGQSLQQTVLRQKNLIFSQLASYCHYMLMMGISSKNVRQIVGRYCRLYEMNDEQNKNLSTMITNTVKQYKQITTSLIKDNKDLKAQEKNQ